MAAKWFNSNRSTAVKPGGDNPPPVEKRGYNPPPPGKTPRPTPPARGTTASTGGRLPAEWADRQRRQLKLSVRSRQLPQP